MKSFTILAISLLAFTSNTISSPLSSTSLTKRTDASTFLPSIQTLTTSVKSYTSSINSTASTFTTLSSTDQSSALSSLASSASSINDLITAYTAQIPTIEGAGGAAAKRQDGDEATQELAGALALLIEEINSSLNYAESETGEDFGITKRERLASRQIAIISLGTSLSALLLALDGVVDDLLALVKEIVDGLLTGLSGALVGLVL